MSKIALSAITYLFFTHISNAEPFAQSNRQFIIALSGQMLANYIQLSQDDEDDEDEDDDEEDDEEDAV